MNGIKIVGTGYAAPSKIVTNDDLAKIVETNDEWITSRTGISRRRHMAEGETFTSITVQAARKALESSGIPADSIGACIVATLTPDTLVPSAACLLQRELGLPMDIPCFDLNAACTGFLYALHTMECLLAVSERKYGLVIGAENLSRIINWEDRGTCILFGDGAGAVVVESRPEWPSISAILGCHGTDQMLRVPGVEKGVPSLIYMEGTKVFKFAVEAVPYCIDQVLARTGKTKAEIKAYIVENFGYDLSRTCDDIRPSYHHVESCQETVPEAITAFIEGESFEAVIRTAVSLGGDCDTLTCIAGAIAEGFYGVPEELKMECRNRLDKRLLEVVDRFDDFINCRKTEAR